MMTTEVLRPVIRARVPGIAFEAGVPRHWLNGHALGTQLANGVNLLFPAGERFFIRSVRWYLDGIDDAGLREQARGFFGQEGRHAQAHERFFEIMEGQGYRVRTFLRVYEWLCYGLIERLAPRKLRLAATAACEHFTAILAEDALSDGILDRAHPVVRDLLRWHAAEEIEHKAVAFDVLLRVSRSYALRMLGLLVAGLLLWSFWMAAALLLLVQDALDGQLGGGRLRSELRVARQVGRAKPSTFLRGIRDYVRRDFHPDQRDNRGLAQAYLAGAGYLQHSTPPVSSGPDAGPACPPRTAVLPSSS